MPAPRIPIRISPQTFVRVHGIQKGSRGFTRFKRVHEVQEGSRGSKVHEVQGFTGVHEVQEVHGFAIETM
jgi:hypothetical protein